VSQVSCCPILVCVAMALALTVEPASCRLLEFLISALSRWDRVASVASRARGQLPVGLSIRACSPRCYTPRMRIPNQRVREMRHNQTEAEKAAWHMLRDR